MDRRRPSDPQLLVLISLSSGAKHGHAMLLDIESFGGHRLGPGTLYGAIERLEQDGLIQPMEGDDRRTPYRITEPGRAYLRDRLATMDRLTAAAHTRLAQ